VLLAPAFAFGQAKGAVAFEDCTAYSKLPSSGPIAIKASTIFSFGKIFPPDWAYTERTDGHILVWYLANPDGAKEQRVWVPEKSVIEFNVNCKGNDCIPWEGILKRTWTSSFTRMAQAALANGKNDNSILVFDATGIDTSDLGKWQYKAEINPITDAVEISFLLESDAPTGGTVIAKPMSLIARYNKGKFEFYISAGVVLKNALNSFSITNTVRYDKESPTSLSFSPDTSGTALFFKEPSTQIQRMAQHSTFAIEVKPHDTVSRYATFELHGLKACLAKFEKDSGQKISNFR
jgi:hypothetical protein